MNFRELVCFSHDDTASNSVRLQCPCMPFSLFQEAWKEGCGFNYCRGKKIIRLKLFLTPNLENPPFHVSDCKKKKKPWLLTLSCIYSFSQYDFAVPSINNWSLFCFPLNLSYSCDLFRLTQYSGSEICQFYKLGSQETKDKSTLLEPFSPPIGRTSS